MFSKIPCSGSHPVEGFHQNIAPCGCRPHGAMFHETCYRVAFLPPGGMYFLWSPTVAGIFFRKTENAETFYRVRC